jgi:diguanylate cyclase (GGDEF)-like protein/PAS domain S-box-containing protein
VSRTRSLTYSLTLQFATIVVPITVVFLYQAAVDFTNANAVKFEVQSVAVAQQAESSFKVFLNGAADAADTGYLSAKGYDGLEQTHQALLTLQAWDRGSQVKPVLERIDLVLKAARSDRTLGGLLAVRTTVNQADKLLGALVEFHQLRAREHIERIAEESKTQVWVACITLALAIGFIYLVVKRLSRPLYRAVSLASSIAAGNFKDAGKVDTRRDIGGLLSSLDAMQINLSQAFNELAQKEAAGRRFRAALDSAADMVFLVDFRNARFVDFNATACRYLGYERAELLGCQADTVLASPLEDLLSSHRDLLESKDRADSRVRTYRRKDGSTFDAEVLRRIVESPDGPILVINARDLTERKAAEERQIAHLRYQEKISRMGQSALGMRDPAELIADAAQSALEALAADAIAYLEPGPKECSVVVRDVLGLAERPSSAIAQFASDDPLAAVLQRGEAIILQNAERAPLPFDWAAEARSAALVPVGGERAARGAFCVLSREPDAFGREEVRFIEAAASVLSAGLQRIDSESRLAFLAQFDALTGLPNRSLLSDRFTQMIVQAGRHGTQLGVLFIDLDDFKLVNDTLGHAGGDELLKQVADRLQASVRSGDTVARISGDEFAIILADLSRAEDGAIVAQKIIDTLAPPIQVRGQEVFATASIGIAIYPADGQEAETLLGAADAAMYRAKQSQRNAYQFFTAEINQRWRARSQLGTELRRALERDEFRLVYQPKIDLKLGRACGTEALLRWKHPERGIVPPAEFIPVLEETGLIVSVGEWVLRRACEDLKAWAAAGLCLLPVAVNLSARQFRQPDLDVRIRAIIAAAGVDPGLIELEITESQLMHDPDQAIRVLRTLREAGIRIAIDDFGTGYSSLSYLTRFPLAALKIDRSFVADVLSDEADATIVRTIVDMAKSLGFTVVAEGVETQGQATFLRGLGCEQAQGFFFAKPMSAQEVGAFFAPIPAQIAGRD